MELPRLENFQVNCAPSTAGMSPKYLISLSKNGKHLQSSTYFSSFLSSSFAELKQVQIEEEVSYSSQHK